MASSDKTKTCPFTAIYRLEFFKNKNNWKFDNVKKRRSSPQKPKTETKLNKTCSVGQLDLVPDCDEEQVSRHNEAFLYEETDDEPNPQPPESEPNPQPHESEPNPQPPESGPPVPPAPQHCLYGQHSWPEQSGAGDKSADLWHQEWESCRAEAEVVPEELANDQCDGPHHDDNVWEPASQYQQLNPDCGAPDPLENLSPIEMLHKAGNWLRQHGWPVLQDECSPTYDQYELLDDSADFERGAHGAPHSSEIDLSVTPHDYPSGTSLRLLTPRRIARAVYRSHSMLARYLRENEIREKLYSHSILLPPMRFNTDPLQPEDYLLSGSHVLSGSHLLSGPHALGVGRGRGRLQQADRVIGISMGRPYRM